MGWTPTPYPYNKRGTDFYLPTQEEAREMVRTFKGERALRQRILKRENAIILARQDPFRGCASLDHWDDAEALLAKYDRLLVSGGNRSGKSMFGARTILRTMAEKANARVACFSMTAASSVRDQQPAVYNFIPLQWKRCKKTRTVDVTYSLKNGFTENTFILPNGSQCFFFHYSQQNDILEGAEFDFVWFDELVPYSWVQTAAYRLVTRKGKMLITATPISGWTPVVNDFINNAKVLQTKRAELFPPDEVYVKGCPPGHMPYIAQCLREDSAVIFFFTEANPFQNRDEMARVLKGETMSQRKIRAYGWTERSQAGYFAKFSKAHVVARDQVPKEGTNYMACDPAGSRMWFALWLRVARDGTMYIYREFPDIENYGEWAELGESPEGLPGEAQKAQGWGMNDYKRLFKQLEGDEVVFERLIDPRAGGTPHQTEDGSETLIDSLDSDPDALHFIAASGVHIEQGITAVNDLLTYNIDEPVSTTNKPKLFISDACGNLIRSLQNISPAGADKNRWKDPIDCLRYLALHECNYVDPKRNAYVGGGSY